MKKNKFSTHNLCKLCVYNFSYTVSVSKPVQQTLSQFGLHVMFPVMFHAMFHAMFHYGHLKKKKINLKVVWDSSIL